MTLIEQSVGSLHTLYVNGETYRQCYWDRDSGEWFFQYYWIKPDKTRVELSGIRRTKITEPKLRQIVKTKTGIMPRNYTTPAPFTRL